MNGITGTAPTSQTIEKGGKVTKPADPTYANHTFAGWYKTKDATTGALSDPWNFDTNEVTADMTLYAQWTKPMKDLLGSNFPNSSDNSAPEEGAWTNENGYKAYTYSSAKFFKLDPGNANGLALSTSNQFTRISDDKYVFEYVSGGTSHGELTLNIENSTLVSIEYKYNGTDTRFVNLPGTYTAPTPTTTGTAKATIGGSQVDVNWVQLWENGPKFAEYNVGASSATDVGSTMTFTDATKAGAEYVWGANWCTPSKDQMDELLKAATTDGSTKVDCNYIQENGVYGFKFTGKETGYTSNSVFFPAQIGESGVGNAGYWSATAIGGGAWYMLLSYDSGWYSGWYWHSLNQGDIFLVRPVFRN